MVTAIYKKIQKDARHHQMTLLGQWRDERRMFADWAMEFRSLDPRTPKDMPCGDPAEMDSTLLLHAVHKLADTKLGLFEIR